MAIPAGMLNQKITITLDGAQRTPTGTPTAYKANIQSVEQDEMSINRFGQVDDSELRMTVRRDSFTKQITQDTLIVFDGITYRVKKFGRRTELYTQLIDLVVGEHK